MLRFELPHGERIEYVQWQYWHGVGSLSALLPACNAMSVLVGNDRALAACCAMNRLLLTDMSERLVLLPCR
jgi:hypothetical protein